MERKMPRLPYGPESREYIHNHPEAVEIGLLETDRKLGVDLMIYRIGGKRAVVSFPSGEITQMQ